MTIYDFTVTAANGHDIPLSDYKGKVLLIANTASKCGFTPQYEGLQELYDQYGKDAFMVLAFPCNQFASQEPGTDEEIQNFCKLNYGVTFPVMSKIDVNGDNAHPLFQYLKEQAPEQWVRPSNGTSPNFSLTPRAMSTSGTPPAPPRIS